MSSRNERPTKSRLSLRRLRQNAGESIVEYALIIGMIGIVALASLACLGSGIDATMRSADTGLQAHSAQGGGSAVAATFVNSVPKGVGNPAGKP